VEVDLDDPAVSRFLKGDRIRLAHFGPHLVSLFYQKWLNDPEINRYTSRGRFPVTWDDCKQYAQTCQSESRIVMAILLNEGVVTAPSGDLTEHIGNITLQQINLFDCSAELAILLGERQGEGYGLEAARLLCTHGFNTLGLNRIYCGTHEENIGMQKLAIKLGMKEEGRRRQAIWKNGKFSDVIEYGILKEEFK
jgi:RimJ/RimL family protein N-acetyltransferase